MGAPGAARSATHASRCVLAALAAIVVLAVPAGAATGASSTPTGSIGLRLLDAAVGGDPRARLYIVDHLAPGTIIHRRVEVANTSDATAHVVLYPAAATIDEGSFVGAEGRTRNELSIWTAVSPRSADLPAGGRATATVTIKVPADAPPGEQYGVVWAEIRSDPKGSEGVAQVNRVGIRIYLSVGPGGAPATNFVIEALTAARSTDGRPTVLATVHNTGGRALDMNGALRLHDGPSGLTAGPFPAALGTTLAVGDEGSVTILLDKELPAGPWDAQITLKSGLLKRTARARITFPEVGLAAPVIAEPEGRGWPYFIVVTGLLLFLALAAYVANRAQRRRKLKDGEIPQDQPLPATGAETAKANDRAA